MAWGSQVKPYDFNYFVQIVNEIQATSYFKPDDETWFSKALQIFLETKTLQPVAEEKFREFFHEEIRKSSPSNTNKILKKGIQSLLLALPDPYVLWLSPREVALERNRTHGETSPGFGLIFAQKEQGVFVDGVVPKSSADDAGITGGELVTRINGGGIQNLQQVNEQIHEMAASLQITLLHQGKQIDYKLKSKPMHLVSFKAEQFGKIGYIGESFGYIRMEVIAPGNDKKLQTQVKIFVKKRVRSLFLDLRNCIGGDVPTAARIAGIFLKPKTVIFYQETRGGRRFPYFNPSTQQTKIPLVILTNKATASAAELIAGALKDYDRATLYGEPTSGKGMIQTTLYLRDGAAIRFTAAEYLTPKQNKVAQAGIVPHVIHFWKKGESIQNLEGLERKNDLQ